MADLSQQQIDFRNAMAQLPARFRIPVQAAQLGPDAGRLTRNQGQPGPHGDQPAAARRVST